MRGKLLLGVALTSLVLVACSFKKSDHPAACRVDNDCESKNCLPEGFCLMAVQDGGTHGGKTDHDAGQGTNPHGDAGRGVDGGHAGEACDDGTPPMNCYDGPDGTADVGICRGGQRACVAGKYTQCLGQVLPGDETCNGKDDDCNGQTDEIPMGDCSTSMKGICDEGALICRGTFAVCEPVNPPVNEVCNGKDDDCDGNTDEMMSAACYPKNDKGCKAGAGGTFVCTGLCQAGHAACGSGGNRCPDAVLPIAEVCTKAGKTAADEDCDGLIDEGCACMTGATRDCYAGPVGTEGNGTTCHAGTQTCVAKTWGDCEGQVVPEPETCSNSGEDNDCDGTKDNIPGLGDPCIDDTMMGICRDGTVQCTASGGAPACVTATATMELCDDIDQDCDGDAYNGFDLNTDPDNCSKCGNSCQRDEGCCEGQCRALVKFETDELNCGACGVKCDPDAFCCQGKCTGATSTSGGHGTIGTVDDDKLCQCKTQCAETENCCGTACVNFSNDVKNCGACGNVCPTVLGLLGSCAKGHCQ